MSDKFDMLLSQPLAETPDNGFSNRVMAQLNAQMELNRLRRDRLVTDIYTGLILLAVMILPFTAAGRLLAASAFTAYGIALVSVTFGAIYLISVRTIIR